MKYFKLDEAEALIPELEKIFGEIDRLSKKGRTKASKIVNRQGEQKEEPASIAQSALEAGQLKFLARQIESRLQTIADLGAFPKGIEPPLVDFPFRLDGREVYLCWTLGEKKIGYYHGFDDGFASRRPLPTPSDPKK